MTLTGRPTYFVHGNHAREVEYHSQRDDHWRAVSEPEGAVNLHARTEREQTLLLAGLEGSIRYNDAPRFQYTNTEMLFTIWGMVPRLLTNRIRYGRYLDVLVAHSPGEFMTSPTVPTRGSKAF
jgi:hypothetical protein